MKSTTWLSRFLCIVILLALSSPRPAQAAPRALLSMAVFSVNSNADNTDYDSYLTLREAMMAAAGNFKAAYYSGEQAQMSGCIFDGLGKVTGGCGAGNDGIAFTADVTQINLTSRLPDIVKDGVTIVGTAGKPVIDFKAVPGYGFGFEVSANYVYLGGMTVINVNGDYGIVNLEVGYKGLTVAGNYLGVTRETKTCADPALTIRRAYGITITLGGGSAAAGGGTAYIYDNVIGCSENGGIIINESPYVYIGKNNSGTLRPNYIGVSRSGDNIGISNDGIDLYGGGTHGNVVAGNQIGYNSGAGIILNGSYGATLSNNNIHHNIENGIYVVNSRSNMLDNNSSHDNGGSGIFLYQSISLATAYNAIIGGAYYRNGDAGITEDSGASKNSWSQVSIYSNGGLGIDKGDDDNVDVPALTVNGVTPAAKGVMVNGTFTVSILGTVNYQIDLYRAERDSSGYGEGKTYIGSTTIQKSSNGIYAWSIPDPSGLICYTATLTSIEALNPDNATSSEFSANLGTMCNLIFLPGIRK